MVTFDIDLLNFTSSSPKCLANADKGDRCAESDQLSFPGFWCALFLPLVYPETHWVFFFSLCPRTCPRHCLSRNLTLLICSATCLLLPPLSSFPWPHHFTSQLILEAPCSPISCACARARDGCSAFHPFWTKHELQDKTDCQVDKSKGSRILFQDSSDDSRLDFYSFSVLSPVTDGLPVCPGADDCWHLHLSEKRNECLRSPGKWGGLFLSSPVIFVKSKDPKVGNRKGKKIGDISFFRSKL